MDAQAPPATLRTLQIGLGWFPESSGGLDRYYHDLMRELPAVGVGCEGIVLGTSLAARDTNGRVQAVAAKDDSQVKRFRQLRRGVREAIQRNSFDLVVAHFALNTLPALGPISGLPLVVHFHGPWAAESRAEGCGTLSYRSRKWIESMVYRRAARIICLSRAFADVLTDDYRVPAAKVRVIPGAIDLARFDRPESRAEARQLLGWSVERPTVLCVRRLVRRMGLENLIQAAVSVRRSVPDVQFLIAGRGPLKESLERQIAANQLGDTVRLLGFVPDSDLPLAYRAADVSVVPSVSLEGFGLVAAESLAAGTPALVTPVGGLPEVVRDLSPTLVFGGHSAGDISEPLSGALRDPLRVPDAQTCVTYARTRFGWPVAADRIRSIYCEAIETHSL